MPDESNPFTVSENSDPLAAADSTTHVYGRLNSLCETDSRGYATPRNRGPEELVLDASEGFIPLWARNVTLRWRFQEASMGYFQDPEAAKGAIRRLFSEALLKWGDATPVRFAERDDAWDFEIVMKPVDSCRNGGCTLASAFFPDAGRHQLAMYPKMLKLDQKEMVDTFIHEIGHVFGLRHFFAQVSEDRWPSVKFGKHDPFTIMNYGKKSRLTAADKSDLKKLYQAVWSGELTEVNGTRIVLVTPFHCLIGCA